MTADILAIGEPLFELNQTTDAEGQPIFRTGFGGDTSNFAVAAARQGARVAYYTRIGVDPFGDAFMELWRREGVDVSAVERDPAAPTGVYFVQPLVSGHAFTYYRAGSAASRMTADEMPKEAIAAARLLHVTGISQAISTPACDAVFAAIETARANGVQVSYDTNLRLKLWGLDRARAIIHEAVRLADICLPSFDDAKMLTGSEDADEIADVYLGLGAGLVVLKLGAEGTLVATPDRRERVAGLRVETVDGTGAGDTFGGAFVARYLAGDDLVDAARYANAAAALSTQGYGAVEPIPRREEVLEFLRERG